MNVLGQKQQKNDHKMPTATLKYLLLFVLLLPMPSAYCNQRILIASFGAMDSLLSKHSMEIAHTVITRDSSYTLIDLDTIKPNVGIQIDSMLTDSAAIAIGKTVGADLVVIGSAAILLGDTTLALRLLSVDSAKIAKSIISGIQDGHYLNYESMLAQSVYLLVQRKAWKKASGGFGLTLGFGGAFYDSKTNSFLGNHGGANAQFDILSGPIALKLKGSVWTVNLEKDIIIGGVNYEQGDKLNPATGTIAIGWVKQVADDIYAIPYAGLSTFSLNYIEDDDAKKKELPTAYGFTIGNSIDYVFYTSNPNDFLGYTVRLDAGLSYINKQDISKLLGSQQYFFSITVGAFGYGSKYE